MSKKCDVCDKKPTFGNSVARLGKGAMIRRVKARTPRRFNPNIQPVRALIKGFIISDHLDRMGDFLRDCGGWLRAGKLKYREDVVRGLDAAPAAFIGLLQGKNFGKLLVEVAPRRAG